MKTFMGTVASNLTRVSLFSLFLLPASLACAPNPPQIGNILANPGFEEGGDPVPAGWTLEGSVSGKGELEVVPSPVHSGSGAVCLRPNRENTADILAFNIGQGMGLDPLRGRTLEAQGWILGRDGATGVLGMYVISATGSMVTQRRLSSSEPSFAQVQGELEIPQEGGSLLVINLHAEGTSGEACFDDLDIRAAGEDTGPAPPDPGDEAGQEGDQLVTNGDFEGDESQGLPEGWTLEPRVAGKGSADLVSEPAQGRKALRLRPNDSNTSGLLGLNVGQGFPATALRGRTLRLSGWLGGEAGSVAVVALYVIDGEGAVLQSRRLVNDGMPPTGMEARLQVPEDQEASLVILSAAAEGTSGAAYFDNISIEVVSSSEEEARPETRGPLSASVVVHADDQGRPIPRTLYGQNLEWPYGGNLIWDFRRGARSEELVDLTRELNTSVLRWPGGLFADFYHWRDGVGPESQRPTTRIFPGGDQSDHVFGTDEALAFADDVGAELLITVNAHTGTPEEAAEWVQYVNDGGSSPRVRFWEVGNEFYIKNEDEANAAIPPEEYSRRLLAFSAALREADPDIRIMGIGAENFGRYNTSAFPDWNPVVLTQAGGAMDFLAVHNAYFPVLFGDEGASFQEVYQGLLAAPKLIAENLRTMDGQIREYAPEHAEEIQIAVTEWGPLFHLDPGSRWIHHVKTLGSALFVASTMKVFIEDPRTTVATAFKLNDIAYQGWIGPRSASLLTDTPTDHDFRPTAPYLAMQMFTRYFGEVWVPSEVQAPTFDAGPVGMVGRVEDAPWLDVVSSRSRNGDTLYVMGINKHFDQPIQAEIQLNGFSHASRAQVRVLRGTGLDANTGTALPDQMEWGKQAENPENPRFSQGAPDEVRIEAGSAALSSGAFQYSFPPHSVTILAIPRRSR